MPPIPEIKTIEHMIFYQYAKIMAKSAFGHKDGKEAKAKSFGYIRNTVRKLISGEKKWSDISREDWQFIETEKKCLYCGRNTRKTRYGKLTKSFIKGEPTEEITSLLQKNEKTGHLLSSNLLTIDLFKV